MNILKIKAEDGTWQAIPAIKGQNGVDGVDGADLLYCTTLLPTTGFSVIDKSTIEIPTAHTLTEKDIVFNAGGVFCQISAIEGNNITVNFLFQITAGTPVKGVDYWTEADQKSIVDQVLTELPSAEGVGY